MVKIRYCYYCAISWYIWNLAWFNEEYIILWPSLWYYPSCDNITKQGNVIMDPPPPPLQTDYLIESTTPVIYKTKIQYRWMWYVNQRKTHQKWLYSGLLWKGKDKKVKILLLVNDNIELVKIEYLYLYLCFLTHDD